MQELGYWLDDPGFESQQWQSIVLVFTTFRPVMEPTKPLVHWYQGPFLGIKRPERDLEHSPPLKMSGAILPLPLHAFMAWTQTTLLFTLYIPLLAAFRKKSHENCTYWPCWPVCWLVTTEEGILT